jgi:hypothetical protein
VLLVTGDKAMIGNVYGEMETIQKEAAVRHFENWWTRERVQNYQYNVL